MVIVGRNAIMTKYHAIRTTIDGITFASKLEAARFQELRLMARAEEISELQLQVPWKLVVNGMLIATYYVDFQYRNSDGILILEDAKGVLTPVYRLKKKLMKACYGIDILETWKIKVT